MSLTNPEKIVTEERLNEYHQTILPYLGGMPDILANKFSRADLYSTDEKMVGRWTDGKPLYQKTFIGNFTPSTAQRVYTQLADLSSLNIDKPINCNGVVKEQSGYFKFLNVSDKGDAAVYTIAITDDKKLSILTSGTSEQTDYIITIQYTKTTDSSVEIGLDTDYSTDEKIIGTWIDGKPVYQKTIDCGTLTNASSSSASKSVYHRITNYGYCINIISWWYDPEFGSGIAPYVNNTDFLTIEVHDTILDLVYRGNWSNVEVVTTLQYIKTTD